MAKRRRRNSTAGDIRAIRESLVSIVETLIAALARVGEASPPAGAPRTSAPPTRPAPATTRMSAERRAALQLQGRYMGLMRALRPRQKAQVKALRAAKGVRPAIDLAARLLKA